MLNGIVVRGELFTYGIDPDAELRGAEGNSQAISVCLDGRRVLVDGFSQQRSCCVVTVKHGGQQCRRLLRCATNRDYHTLSWWQRQRL